MNNTKIYEFKKAPSVPARILEQLLVLLDRKNSVKKKIETDTCTSTPAQPKKLKKLQNFVTSSFEGRPLWVVKPAGQLNQTILYLHGGAFVNNMHTVHWSFVAQLHKDNPSACIIVPDYPLSPEHKAIDLMRYLESLFHTYLKDVPTGELVLMGDSAGANLSLILTAWMRDQGFGKPKAVVPICPALNMDMQKDWDAYNQVPDVFLNAVSLQKATEVYRGNLPVDHGLVSPINLSFHDFPPIHLFMGTKELLMLDSDRLWERAQKENIPLNYYKFRGMMHVWPLFTFLREAKHVREIINDVLR